MNNSHKNSNSPTSIQIPNYQITQTVYAGSRTIVYRAVRTDDQLPVIIKLMKRQYPTFSELVQFRNQYSIAKNLDIPGLVKPYSLELYHNGYALVMEDFGGISLEQFTHKKPLTIEEFLPIAWSLTDILHSIHQQRVIHKDIKPANILIHPDTKQVKLIDFSISTLLPRETQQIQSINALEGTLAYLSPEQTGRMNRGIDYRSDYYSLGITWFELLTGKLPFQSDDPMELVHCHIAKQPPNLRTRGKGKGIPQVLCDIVMKLIAKNAEDRYHSTLGLKHDLEQCLLQLNETAKIEYFQIGQRDLSDRFLIPDKLFGREAEIETLIQAFGRVANGASELMLVTGFSGIGKTAIVNEVHKPIVRSKGYFIKGKYDQFQRNIPFSGLVQTFRDLMGQLLSESDAQLEQWKAKILSALGENGQVLIDVIPELEEIIGKQPSAIELAASAAQNRFNLLFVKFIEVFATLEHPLVMFLDDLQWADSASLGLMKLLMSQAEGGYLFIIGAYRDNEVFPAHPLMLALEEIQKTMATVNTIALTPLSQSDVNLMIADTLSCAIERAMLLTELVYQKAKGNPFFTTQFLKALYEDGLIAFDWNTGSWQCDVAQVRSLALTDDVVEFMAQQLQKLPPNTQDILKLAACIGNQFDLGTLAIVYEKSQIETAADLWKALQEGFVIPINEVYKFYQAEESATVQILSKKVDTCSYKFLHDRVQQAAYSLIPDDRKQATHLKIGQLVLQNSSEIEQEEKLFDIVGHLNLGIELISKPTERQTLAQLNLKAGVKARNSTAYAAARIYLQIGIDLLTSNCWVNQYELTLNLYVAAAEVVYLNHDFDGLEQMATLVLQSTQTILDKVKIYELKIASQTAQGKMLEAIAVGRDALEQLGVKIPTETDENKIGKALQILGSQQGDKLIEELVDLPVMSDATTQAAIQLLGTLFPPVFLARPGLLPILSSMMVSLSMDFGNAPTSTVGYAIHGMVLCAFLGEVETGYSFGKLAMNLLDRFNIRELEATIPAFFGSFIQHRQEAIRATIPTLKGSYTAAMETGNFLQSGYSILNYLESNFFGGVELDTWETEIAIYSAVMAQAKQYSAQTYFDMMQQTVNNLRKVCIPSDCLIGKAYDETVMLPKHHQNNELTVLAKVYVYKLLLAYCYGNNKSALDYIAQAKPYLMAISGLIQVPIFHLYAALTYLAIFPTKPKQEQSEILALVESHQTILQQWAQNAPMNHQHKWYLVEGEKYRILGNKADAIDLYDRAISLAKEHLFLNEEALGNELAAKFYLDWGKEKIAQAYMIEAYYCYARWGAKAKVTDLEKRYPQLLAPILLQPHTSVSFKETIALGTIASTKTSSSVSEVLDLATLLKVSQAISGEIELDQLLTTLLQIVMTNAGASKCVLLLKQDIELQVAAFVEEGQEPQLLPPMPLESSQNVAIALVNTVKRSLKPLVLVDARLYPEFSGDRYIEKHQPKSVLCSPILNQGKLIGILYLENNLTIGAFTSDRVELLNLLCSQAAISIENARLYQQSQQALTELRASEARFHKMADNIPGMVFQLQLAADGAKSITYASSGCINLYEAEPEMVMAGIINVFDPVDAGDLADVEQAITKSAQTLTPFNHEWRSVTPSGTMKWVQAISQPERRGDGLTVWDGVVFDVSDRKRSEAEYKAAETALQISEQNLRTIFNNVSSAIIIHDLDGKVLDVNNRVLEMFGVEREQALQCSILNDYSTPDNPFHLVEDWWRRVLAGETIQFEWNVRKIDSNTVFEVDVTLNRIILDGKAVILGNVLDISDRKRAEAAIIQKSQELEQALQNLQQTQLQMIQSEKMSALGNLVAGVAHEINNPVGFLTGNITPALDYINDLFGLIDLVQQKYPQLDPEIQEELETIELDYIREDLPKLIESMQEGVKRIQDISISLRTFSRADSDRPVACNIHEGIDSTIMILKHRLKANDTRPKIQVIKDYGDLPKIECYAGQLNQVFMNILGNAIDALDELNIGRSYAEIKANPNQIIVTTELSGDRKQVVIRITDNGIGMNEAVRQKVFDNLFTTKIVGKGTGLGLAIARQIVEEKHGGSLKVNSILGKGTEFIITLPIKAV
ncbi:AAA family ATPase [Tychonema sp. LEGE 06208]|uniref:ATP-binding sensor histidine kinase n=1 Tax=Tychonema sp. LEGE 06208 TaxID=1828663 RepID=UPI00188096A9|nr:AAA family ATPase [Tychonema sp. LEGE 06208]MBE9161598.1 AAA family ATPase [Tychonema sp. LEGE 06208]